MDRVRTSKFLSLVLRHRPQVIGIELDDAGWVGIPELLDAMARHGRPITRAELEAVVASSDKQRFAIDQVTERIRANQGHSVEVALGLPEAVPPALLYHGTPGSNLESILRHGLTRKGRHAVHLSPDAATAERVGARRGAAVVLRIASGVMHADGHRFTVSANGVWLTEAVPPHYVEVLV